jgi:septal ring factor EnvC (AmiA/AmiB activator)
MKIIKCLLFLIIIPFSLSAQQSKIGDLEKERMATLQEIEETNKLLKDNKTTINNAMSRLNLIGKQIESRKKIIKLLNDEISGMDGNINSKEIQVRSLQMSLEKKKENYAASVKKMYSPRNSSDNLLFIFSAESFTQSYRRMLYLNKYADWRKKEAVEITRKQNLIKKEKAVLEEDKKKKISLLSERKSEEQKLSAEESDKKGEIKLLEKDKSKLQNELAAKRRQAEALNRQIEKIISEDVSTSGKKSDSQKDQSRVAETKGGYAMTPNEKILSSNFANNQGKLPYPLKGNYKIVGDFGVHQHSELTYVSTNNNGIDIETTTGNEARSVFDGVVSRVFVLPGYNNSIIVRHGNYLTLYSYIDQVYVKQGDKVTTGQALGKIYTDKANNSTVLHFEIWKEQTKLNPSKWIIKR